jgi:hypothetical protein
MVTGNPAPELGLESKSSFGRFRAPAGMMRPAGLRALTDAERRLAAEVFGQGLDADRIRLFALPLWRRAFVVGAALIVWPARAALADFAAAPLGLQATFVHELAHVWQAQRGVFLPIAKLRAGDGPGAYAYDLDTGEPFLALNIEQQASIVEHAFLAQRGGQTPFAAARYAAIASEWRNV